MRHISGHYITKKGKTINFSVDIPASWSELNVYQTAALLEVLAYSKANASLKVAVFLSVLFGENCHIVFNLPDDELLALAPLTNFIVETRPEVINALPMIIIGERGYHSPASDLSNLGFGEWCFAYQVYHYYCIEKQPALLDQLVAILYRPRDLANHAAHKYFNGDLRVTFNENHVPQRSKSVARLEPIVKHTVLAWFASALNGVMKDRPNLFPEKTEQQLLEPPETDDHRTWFTVFRELLGPKWGTEDKLKFTNALFVLDALEEQEIERKSRTPAD